MPQEYEIKEDDCVKTSIREINASIKFVAPSKYQAAYDKLSYPRSIFNKNVGNIFGNVSNNSKNGGINRTLTVPKPDKKQSNATTKNVIFIPLKENGDAGRNAKITDNKNSPKVPNSITNKIYKVRCFFVINQKSRYAFGAL